MTTFLRNMSAHLKKLEKHVCDTCLRNINFSSFNEILALASGRFQEYF